MKKPVTLLLLAAFISITASRAQGNFPRRSVEERVKATMEKLAGLKLEKAGQDSTEAVFTAFFKAQDKARSEMMGGGGPPDRQQMHDRMQKLIAERDDRLKKIFSEAQFKQWKEDIEPSLWPGRGGNRGGNRN